MLKQKKNIKGSVRSVRSKKVNPKKTRKTDEEKVLETINEKEKKKEQEEKKKLKIQKQRSKMYKDNDQNKFYVTNRGLMEELEKWRDSSPDINERKPSERFAEMFIQIANRLTNHSMFRNYPQQIKEDMISYACEKFVTGVKNYNFKFKNPFAYFTQSCFNSFKTVLSKHYKQVNIKRSLSKKMMTQIEAEMPGSGLKKSLDNRFQNDDYIDCE